MALDIDAFLSQINKEGDKESTNILPELDLSSEEEEIEGPKEKPLTINTPKDIENTKKQIREYHNNILKNIENRDLSSIIENRKKIIKLLKNVPGYLEVHFLEVKREDTKLETKVLEYITSEREKIKKYLKENFKNLVDKIKNKRSKEVFEQLFQIRAYWNQIHPLIRNRLLQEEDILRKIELEAYSFLIKERNIYAKKKVLKVKELEMKCRLLILEGKKEEAEKYYQQLSYEINKNHICSPEREEDMRKMDKNINTIIQNLEETQKIISNLNQVIETKTCENLNTKNKTTQLEKPKNSPKSAKNQDSKSKKETLDEKIDKKLEEFKNIETKKNARKKYKDFKKFLRDNNVDEDRQKELIRELAKEWRMKK